ncbi:hypothetical protein PR202_gb12990 [Eleusine coracana subsp. coracana]|uniref:Uncharacterized protein n=1 Tax=Eleusine coracana subsp. coracana TaxID=191504 RepID=A0AAV5ES11_ELECO|nr:hypothetical protein PR202_gb12990 [Eleusine coracana subsp. coracana]
MEHTVGDLAPYGIGSTTQASFPIAPVARGLPGQRLLPRSRRLAASPTGKPPPAARVRARRQQPLATATSSLTWKEDDAAGDVGLVDAAGHKAQRRVPGTSAVALGATQTDKSPVLSQTLLLPLPTHHSLPNAAAAANDDRRRSSPLAMASPGHSDSKGAKSFHTEEKKPTASGRGDGLEAPPAKEMMARLPREEVIEILSRDPRSIEPYNVEAIRGLVLQVQPNAPEEAMRFVAETFNKEMREHFIVFQSWVRGEFEQKGYVLVPEEFITEREESRKRHGHIDLYLPARHFTTVLEADGSKKYVFSFKKKEKVASESKEDDIFLSYSSEIEPEGRAACCKGVKSSHTNEKKPTTAAASGPSGKVAAAVTKGMTRLPKLEVVKILSRDPTSIKPYDVQALCRLALEERPDVPEEVLRLVADSFNKEAREQFIVFQDWVFEEYKKKSCVEVPDEFIEEMEDARRRQGGQIDLYLPHRHFTTVVEDDGSEKFVFCFKKKEKVVPDSKSNEDNMFLSFSAEVESKIKAAFCMMLLESSGDEEESDDKEDRGDSDEDD